MKKLLSFFLVSSLCFSLSFVFTACLQSHTHSASIEWSKDDSYHWHCCKQSGCDEIIDKENHIWGDGRITTPATAETTGIKTYTCTICSQEKNEAIIYIPETQYTVTKAEWNSFMENINFSLVAEIYSDDSVLIYTEVLKSTQTSIFSSSPNEICYTVLKDNVWYDLFEVDGIYNSTPSHIQEDVLLPIGFYLLGDYSDFDFWTYDESEKAYFVKGNIDNDFIAKIYFENGKVTKMSVNEHDEYQIFFISDVGTTKIEEPQIADPIDFFEAFSDKITKEQNFMATMTISDIPLFGTISDIFEQDGNLQHISGSFVNETYTEIVNNSQYQYSQDSYGKWVKEKIENDLENPIQNFNQLMNPNNYVLAKDSSNIFHQKDDVVFENHEDVTISFRYNSCIIEMVYITTFSPEINVQSIQEEQIADEQPNNNIVLKTEIIINNVGNVNITLPVVE